MDNKLEIDLLLALQLQERFEEEFRQEKKRRTQAQHDDVSIVGSSSSGSKRKHHSNEDKLSVSLVDPVWEVIDPLPDIHTLFCAFSEQFFSGKLNTVAVSWSPRMTRCAGVCSYERRGGLCSIRLSVPLLKLRPRSDLVETLLHEMIHAFLFVTANNRDRDGHGPEFHKHMHRINDQGGTKISVYHSFHDEVAVYKQHVWQCSGPCRRLRPYYGLVKRSMNRAPGPNDRWWSQHRATCDGTYKKIKEPEGYSAKGSKRKAVEDKVEPSKRIKNGTIIFTPSNINNNIIGKNNNKTKASKSSSSTSDIRSYLTGNGNSLQEKGHLTGRSGNGIQKDQNWSGSSNVNPKLSSSDSKSNIKGSLSTSTGVARAVDVSNASKANVFGIANELNTGNNKSSNEVNASNSSAKISNKFPKTGFQTDGDINNSASNGLYNPTASGKIGANSNNNFSKGSSRKGTLGFGSSGTITVNPRSSRTSTSTQGDAQKQPGRDKFEVTGRLTGVFGLRDGEVNVVGGGALVNDSVVPFHGTGVSLAAGLSGAANRRCDSFANNNKQRSFLPGSSEEKPLQNVSNSNHYDKNTGNKSARPVSRLLAEYDATKSSSTSATNTTTSNSNANISKGSNSINYRRDNNYISDKKCTDEKINLLNNSSANKSDKNDKKQQDETKKSADLHVMSSDESDMEGDSDGPGSNAHKNCPLCNCSVMRAMFSEHIAECVGGWGTCDFEDIDELYGTDAGVSEAETAATVEGDQEQTECSLMSTSVTHPRSPVGSSPPTNMSSQSNQSSGQPYTSKSSHSFTKTSHSPSKTLSSKTSHSPSKTSSSRTSHSSSKTSHSPSKTLSSKTSHSPSKTSHSPSKTSSSKTYHSSSKFSHSSSKSSHSSTKISPPSSKTSQPSSKPSASHSQSKSTKMELASLHSKYIDVSDTDDEFDDKYYAAPVMSIVQTTQLGAFHTAQLGAFQTEQLGAFLTTRAVPRPDVISPPSGALALLRSQAMEEARQASKAKKFPCPVCQELYTEEFITSTHLNTHFS